MNLPAEIYTEKDIARARQNAKAMGWLQGGAVVFVGGWVLSLVGWIPTVLVAGGLGYVAYRLLTRKSKKKQDDAAEQ